MSGPTPSLSLPREIFELMTVEVTWESFQGFDGHAEPRYAAPVELLCWREAHGLIGGGLEVFRYADGTQVEPQWDLYFDGDDANAQAIQLYDRFTPGGVASEGVTGDNSQSLQAVRIGTMVGPNWDNTNPWLVVVTL